MFERLTRSDFLASLSAVLALIASLGPLIFGIWLYRFLKDERVVVYAASFAISLVAALTLIPGWGRRTIARAAAIGVAAGYGSGLIAYLSLAFASADAPDTFARTMERWPVAFGSVFLLSPIFTGAWVLGGAAGMCVEFLRRKAQA